MTCHPLLDWIRTQSHARSVWISNERHGVRFFILKITKGRPYAKSVLSRKRLNKTVENRMKEEKKIDASVRVNG